MSRSPDEDDDSSNEMFQMSSMRIQEDSARVRLLSSSDDERTPPQQRPSQEVHLPDLNFRQNGAVFSKSEQEKKFKQALISVLIIGITLIITINIGLGIKLKSDPITQTTMGSGCPEETAKKNERPCGSFPWQNYRLPTYVKPSHYHLFLHSNLTKSDYNGKVYIIISVDNVTDSIVLHSKDLELHKVAIHHGVVIDDTIQSPSVVPQRNAFQVCSELDFIAIQCSEKLVPGKTYTIHIDFVGNLSSALSGFYMSKYTTKTGENRTIATTQFESTYARQAFPCFDEPLYKANYTISIVRDAEYSAISNMPVKKTTDFKSHLKMDVFETSVKMSTYLVAFIITDFASISRTIPMKDGKMKVSVYAPKDKIGSAEFALDVACKVISFYENLYVVPYPLPKLDLVAIPNFEAGAMENWGLVTFRETLILYNETTSSTADQERVAIVITHELAHQWFGNLVTMEWWNDLWLNEGFASYMEYLGTDGILPDWHIMQSFNFMHTESAMSTDQSEFTHPITVPVDNSIQIGEVFDDISYSKGACVIAMLVNYLTKDVFFGGITDYLNEYAYKNTINTDLIAAVSNKVDGERQKNIKKMMHSWTTLPGFPVLTITKSADKVTVSQGRYQLPNPDKTADHCHPPPEDPVWQIPLSYITNLSPEKPSWQFLDAKKTSFSIPGNPSWIKFNVRRQGYYVVDYRGQILDELAAQLKKNHSVFSPSDRAGIVFDLGKAARAGYLSYEKVFDTLEYAKREKEYQPLLSIYYILKSIEKKLRMQFDADSHHNIKSFVTQLLSPMYDEFGWPSTEKEETLDHLQKKLRRNVVTFMCSFDDQKCTEEAHKRFLQWKINNTVIPLDYKSVVYSVGLKLGTLKDWEYMWNLYSTDLEIDEQERRKILRALCETTDERKVEFLLEESIKGEAIRSQDTASVLGALMSTKVGTSLVWKFFREKFDDVVKIYSVGSFAVRQAVKGILGTFTDKTQIAGAEKFFEAKNLSDIRYVKRALDMAKTNVYWIENYQPQIVKWLHESGGSV